MDSYEFEKAVQEYLGAWKYQSGELRVMQSKLRDVSAEAFQAAVEQIIASRENRFKPAIGVILRMAYEEENKAKANRARSDENFRPASEQVIAASSKLCAALGVAANVQAQIAAYKQFMRECPMDGDSRQKYQARIEELSLRAERGERKEDGRETGNADESTGGTRDDNRDAQDLGPAHARNSPLEQSRNGGVCGNDEAPAGYHKVKPLAPPVFGESLNDIRDDDLIPF